MEVAYPLESGLPSLLPELSADFQAAACRFGPDDLGLKWMIDDGLEHSLHPARGANKSFSYNSNIFGEHQVAVTRIFPRMSLRSDGFNFWWNPREGAGRREGPISSPFHPGDKLVSYLTYVPPQLWFWYVFEIRTNSLFKASYIWFVGSFDVCRRLRCCIHVTKRVYGATCRPRLETPPKYLTGSSTAFTMHSTK